ncbi:hypothetical protein ACHAXR_002615, partial [Thalassiosira sp. AJA248-18]
MPVDLIPTEIIELYNLQPKIKNGYVYMEIQRGMYGLPQSGMLANKLLKERLEEYGFVELPHTPGLFKHETRPIWFCLTVDDFGIKYFGKENTNYLIDVLEKYYEMEWHYDEGYVDISMPGYVNKQLVKYKHPPPKRRQDCPYEPNPIKYGKQSDEVVHEKISPPLSTAEQKYVQGVIGSFLYYARAVDLTILMALSAI